MVHYIMFLNMYSRFWHNKCLFCFYLYSLETKLLVSVFVICGFSSWFKGTVGHLQETCCVSR